MGGFGFRPACFNKGSTDAEKQSRRKLLCPTKIEEVTASGSRKLRRKTRKGIQLTIGGALEIGDPAEEMGGWIKEIEIVGGRLAKKAKLNLCNIKLEREDDK